MLIAFILSHHFFLSVYEPADLFSLSKDEQAIYHDVIGEEFCACNSPLTIRGCLELKPDCQTAKELSRLAVKKILSAPRREGVLAFLSTSILGPFCEKPIVIDTTQAPQKGKKSAPLTLIEFADFRCSHCRQAAPLIKQSLAKYEKDLRFIFMPFPVQNHPHSVLAAEAVLAADAQGKFWPMYDALFKYPDINFELPVLETIAMTAGVNLQRFRTELAGKKQSVRLQSLKKIGEAIGVEGTPRFYLNGRPFDFMPPLLTLEDGIALEQSRYHGKCQ